MSARLNFALQQLFRDIASAAAQLSADFFIYFWRIAISLRDIRCHGEQKLQRNKQFLLSTFLKYTRFLFSSVNRNHPFTDFAAWLEHAFHTGPLQFKCVVQWAYWCSIRCVKEAIGDYHPIVLGMMAHHEKNWRTNNSYKSTSIRMYYDGYIRKAENKGKDATLLVLDYMNSMSVSECEADFRQTKLLAASVRQKTRPDSGSQWHRDIRVEAFIQSTDWLANEYYKRNDGQCYEVLADAINILRHGDQVCCIWAATFSRRKALWHKSTINYKAPATKPPSRSITIPGKEWLPKLNSQSEKELKKEKYRRETTEKWREERKRLDDITQTIKSTAVVYRGDPSQFRGNKKRKERREKQKKEQALVFMAVDNSLMPGFHDTEKQPKQPQCNDGFAMPIMGLRNSS
ncbi:hypothetical protein H634G_11270 [Metarhizium anisopliae BRIP 53293]|uniref:Uncharacterized protein n=1 Tax=Metarhizium anisopliae BRIP 53293 TaxID=1291518 RepID=A0A0D9NHS6_METAN|nr:hypothetical protein H634G_11270 [Metarhizium anisopliae BRIP 53293]